MTIMYDDDNWIVDMYMVKDASAYRANRIIFDSDSDDDNDSEPVSGMINTVPVVQPDKQVTLLFIRIQKTQPSGFYWLLGFIRFMVGFL